jgi:hypothetical protein
VVACSFPAIRRVNGSSSDGLLAHALHGAGFGVLFQKGLIMVIDHPVLVSKFQAAVQDDSQIVPCLKYALSGEGVTVKSVMALFFRILKAQGRGEGMSLKSRWQVFRDYCADAGIVLPEAAGVKSDDDFLASFGKASKVG